MKCITVIVFMLMSIVLLAQEDKSKKLLVANPLVKEVLNEYIDKNQNNLLMFSFTPIYVDLNGNKRIQESRKVACVSPFINEEKRKELKEKSGEYLVDSGDYDLSSKVCKQYAKFKK